MSKRKKTIRKTCEYCGKEFWVDSSKRTQRFCSQKCAKDARAVGGVNRKRVAVPPKEEFKAIVACCTNQVEVGVELGCSSTAARKYLIQEFGFSDIQKIKKKYKLTPKKRKRSKKAVWKSSLPPPKKGTMDDLFKRTIAYRNYETGESWSRLSEYQQETSAKVTYGEVAYDRQRNRKTA